MIAELKAQKAKLTEFHRVLKQQAIELETKRSKLLIRERKMRIPSGYSIDF